MTDFNEHNNIEEEQLSFVVDDEQIAHSEKNSSTEPESKKRNRLILRIGAIAAAAAIASAGAFALMRSNGESEAITDMVTETDTLPRALTLEDEGVIVSTAESIYVNLPSSENPEDWAEEVYGIFNVIYNENRTYLFEYAFGGEYYNELVEGQLSLIAEVTKFKKDPSKLDDFIFSVRVLPERTMFDGDDGVIRVEETRYFKWQTNVAVIDLAVGRHDVVVNYPDGNQETKSLLLIEGWKGIESSFTNGAQPKS